MATKGSSQKKDLLHYLKLVFLILSLVMLVVVCILAYRFGRRLFTNDGVTDEAHEVTYTLKVTKGESVYQIGKDLETHGIISSRLAFLVQSKLYNCRIAPGEYTVRSSMSSKAILKYLNAEYLKAKESNANK